MSEHSRLFPHSVLLEPARIRYARLDRSRVSQAVFADYRLEIRDEDLQDQSLSLDGPALKVKQGERFCFIFHTAFCGSTLISDLLDQPGSVVSIKEPQGIRDLSEIKAYYLDWMSLRQLQGMLVAYLTSMADWATSDRHILIKPSNLANGLASDLVEEAGGSKAVLLSCSMEDFLLACLGKDRRLLQLISTEVGHWHRNFPERRRYNFNPVILKQNPLYGPAVVWHLQRLHLEQLRARMPGRISDLMDFGIFNADPVRFMKRVAESLDVPLDSEAVLKKLGSHAKTGKPFSPEEERLRRDTLAAENANMLKGVQSAMEPLLQAFPVKRLERSL
jgi:hypothetical protein